MSLFSRLFRKAPLPAVPPEKPPENFEPPRPAPNGPDRAVVAAKEAAEIEAALEARDSQTIGRLVLEGSSTKIRQQAAQAVQDLEQLRQLIKEVRGGNDKSVYKILTGKRDALLIQARQREQLDAEIAAASMRSSAIAIDLTTRCSRPRWSNTKVRWSAVAADAAPEIRLKAQEAIDRSREVIAHHLRQIAVEASRELAAANAAAEAQRQRELAEKAAAAAAAERAQLVEAERKALAEKHEAESIAFRQIGGLIRKAHGALNEGSTGRAAGLRRAIEEKLATAPPLPPHLTTSIQLLDKKLEELKDWKSFSVAPKRIELMEEMESLVGATIEPVALADRIKSLQEEWRTLSKGAGENVEADWQRFQEAAQKAYQPCREYFEAQGQVRQENLQRRAALLERLSAFVTGHDWEHPDWRTVIVALRESKQEWRTHSPVDRAAGQAAATAIRRTHGRPARPPRCGVCPQRQGEAVARRARAAARGCRGQPQGHRRCEGVATEVEGSGSYPARRGSAACGKSFDNTAMPCFKSGSTSMRSTARDWRPTRRRPVQPARSSRESPRSPATSCWKARHGFRSCASRSRQLVSFRGAMSAACGRDSSERWSGAKELLPVRKRAMRSAVGLTSSMLRIESGRIARRSPGKLPMLSGTL